MNAIAGAAVGGGISTPGLELAIIDLDADLQDDAGDWLSPSELARAARFVFSRDQFRYRKAHAALRSLLWTRCGFPAEAEFDIGPNGRPDLPTAFGCSFNLSRSGPHALVGFLRRPGDARPLDIGVDLECVKPIGDLDTLARATLTAREVGELARCPAPSKMEAYLTAWTRKEACLKAIGTGLLIAASDVEAGTGTQARTVCLQKHGEARSVEVTSIGIGAGLVAAIAVCHRTNDRSPV